MQDGSASMRLIFTACLAVMLGTAVHAQESWCNGSGLSPTERTICNDPRLRDLDDELNRVYRATGAEELDAEQTAWLRRRNACGTDILCLQRAYEARIRVLGGRAAEPAAPDTPMRPWCDAGTLNPTERSVCSDDMLADLDAALEAVYGSLRARDSDASQVEWLREERDACGQEVDCIAQTYLRRIVELGGRLRAQ